MNLLSAAAALLVAGSSVAQTPTNVAPPTLERLCGRLEHTGTVPIKGDPQNLLEKDRNLPHVVVSLYPADENRDCCAGQSAVAATKTSHWGGFEIKSKRIPSGLYWLQVEPEGRTYRTLIRFNPKRYSDQLCSETIWDVDDAGNFRKATFITVD